jgi:hypothetical protein
MIRADSCPRHPTFVHARLVTCRVYEEPTTSYEILVRGDLGERLAGELGARRFDAGPDRTLLVVEIIDQSHLHGVLGRLGDLNLEIERVSQLARADDPSGGARS